jgi:hypothetical protein
MSICSLINLVADKGNIFSVQILGINFHRSPTERELSQQKLGLMLCALGGMVLAIPLMQAAVGPFRSVNRLRQGDDTSCLLN